MVEKADERLEGIDNDVEHTTVDGVDGIRMRCQNRKASSSSDTSQPLARTTTDPKGKKAPQSDRTS